MEEAEAISERESSPEPKRRSRKRETQMPPPPKEAAEEPEGPSTRRTRSQAAPEWTTKEALVLVNEIAAIEGDWLKALSSYQKWKIVVEHCNAMDVRRNLFQCRGKWNSLLTDYNLIKQWGCKARQGSDPYWSLDRERRKQFGLPENFDDELFKAIDEYVRSQADEMDSDPETDPDADAELLEVIARLGSKRKKRYISVLEVEGEPLQGAAEGLSQGTYAEENPQLYYPEEGDAEEMPGLDYPEEEEGPGEEIPVEEMHQPQLSTEEKQVRCWIEEKNEGAAVKVEEENNMEEAHVEEKNEAAVEEEEAHNENPVEEEEDIQEKETIHAPIVEEEAHHEIPAQEELGIHEKETNEAAVLQVEAPRESLVEEEGVQRVNVKNGEVGGGQQEMCVEEQNGDDSYGSESIPSGEVEVEGEKNGDEKSKSALGEQRPHKRGRKPKALVEEEKMVEQVYEHAKLMIAIAETKYPTPPPEPGFGDDAAVEAAKTEFVRRQADQLIASLGKILSILEQYPYLVQKYS
ncbi:unnamed protein product [Linum tenue]|uniref:Myb-like domain-containing protein n=1 Tax=Linum tenue TaxID=586396 RepID=A0AAV0GTH8_9ROSI|nr:unnamed protein product [Linum tenue]